MSNRNTAPEQQIFEKAEKELKLKLIEFTEKTEIQSQTAEAFYIWKDDPNMIIEFTSEDDIDDHTFTRFMDWFMFDFKTLDRQKRVIDLFYEEQANELSDIEKKLLSDWMNSYQSFLELRDKNGSDCVFRDILSGRELVVRDKNSSKNAELSDILFARPLKTGECYYFSGAISIYPNIFRDTIIEYFNNEYGQYKKISGSNPEIQSFLRDWSYIICNRIDDVVKHPQFLTRDGEEFVLSSSHYEITDHNTVADRLKRSDKTREITDSLKDFRGFLLENRDAGYSASIELYKDLLSLKCNSRNKLAQARKWTEDLLKDCIKHKEDTFTELDSFIYKDKHSTGNKDNLPSNNLQEDQLYREMDSYYEKWIYTPLDALDGLTPVKAMKTSRGKEKLENVLKELESIYEHARKVGEPFYDIRKLRDKLRENTG